jgi:fatty acid desaturase
VENARNSWSCNNSKNLVEKKELKKIMKRDNYHGLIHYFSHLSLILCFGILLAISAGTWWMPLFFIIQGTLIAFLFAPLHECIHSSVFKSRRLNNVVGHISGLIILRPFLYSKYRHMAHHTWTQKPGDDPDQVHFPKSYTEYFAHISSFNIWHRLIKNLILLASGKTSEDERSFIPKNEITYVIREARLMLLIYLCIFLVSLWFQSWIVAYLWLGPRVIGEVALRSFRMVEHTGMEESPNMLANTRTTKTNFLVRALYWNMPYHAEHHLYPNVPFHALPRLHKHLKPHLKEIGQGVFNVHMQILSEISKRKNSQF